MLAVGLGGVPQVPSYRLPDQSPLGQASNVGGGGAVVVGGLVVDVVAVAVGFVVVAAGLVAVVFGAEVVAEVVERVLVDAGAVLELLTVVGVAGGGADGATDAVGVIDVSGVDVSGVDVSVGV